MSDEVHTYIAQFPDETQQRLQTLQDIVRGLCPGAVEAISYGLIGYKLNGNPLVYFGGFKKHVGLYATPAGQEAFAEEFARYVQGKGSVQFPLAEPLPVELITRVVAHRVDAVSDELPQIGRPARSALEALGITRLSQLTTYSEPDLLALHGVGPKAIRILRESGAQFRGDT